MRTLTAVVLALLLSACGFYLRGDTQAVKISGSIYLSEKSTGLVASDLRQWLREQNALATGSADPTLEISIEERQQPRINTPIGSDERSFAIELRYTATLGSRTDPEAPFQMEEITVVREYIAVKEDPLDMSDDEDIQYEEMRGELLRNLQQRLITLTQEAN